jgi:superfamily II DNA or RNA helicase
MSDELAGLFSAIRQECSTQTWTKAVKLSRAGGVVGEREDADEAVLRVSEEGRAVSPTVTLSLVDEDWSCDCGSDRDPCEHVAAGVIALKQARGRGEALPTNRRMAKLAYRLRRVGDMKSGPSPRVGGGLALDRVLVADGKESMLRESLIGERKENPELQVAASKEDLAVELALGQRPAGQRLPKAAVRRILQALSKCHDISLDGAPISVGEARPAFVAQLSDDPSGGFRLQLAASKDIDETLADETAIRVGDTLHPTIDLALAPSELAALRKGQVFAPDRAGSLAAEVLPMIRKQLPVEVNTRRLPTAKSEPPYMRIELQARDEGLYALPTLCYGHPPHARVTHGRLELLDRKKAVPLRDSQAERRLVSRLFEQTGLRPGIAHHAFDQDAMQLAEALKKARGVELSAPKLLTRFAKSHTLAAKLRVDQTGNFELGFVDGDASGGEISAERVLTAWQAGRSLLPIAGGLAELPLDWLSRYGHRIASLLRARELAKDGKRALSTATRLDLAQLCHELDYPAPQELSRLREQLEEHTGIPRADLPALTVELRSYQKTGIDWLCFLRELGLGALLADDMGLGKTLQALCAVNGRTLVVAPTSVLKNWINEANRFRPDLRCGLYHGPSRSLDPNADLTVTSYALLRLDADKLGSENWTCVVLDEAQQIKNPESQVAQAAYGLRSSWYLTLTGTPVENRLQDLWSIFHFMQRGLLGGRSEFQRQLAEPIARGDINAISELRRKTAPLIMRRKKSEVAKELPPRTEIILECELDDKERELYDTLVLTTKQHVIDRLAEGNQSVMAVLEALLRLRQACCHSGLLPDQERQSSSKVELLLDRLIAATQSGHKSLVFSQWTGLLDRVEPALENAELSYCRLDGATRDRQAVVDLFSSDDGPSVMLISLKAGGVGINLTAADHVYLLDPWWNPATEDQAADRAHRIGQTRPVIVFKLVAAETVEQRILELQQKKRALADAALSGAATSSGLSRKELLQLLE